MTHVTNGPPYISTGLAAAAARLEHALTAGGPNDCFVAIFETVMWIAVMDKRFDQDPRYKELKVGEPADVLQGCWHAWNSLKHRSLDAIVDLTDGAQWPLKWTVRWGEIRWKPADDFPGASSAARVDCYRRALEGRPVRQTLPIAVDFIQSWMLSPRSALSE